MLKIFDTLCHTMFVAVDFSAECELNALRCLRMYPNCVKILGSLASS